jgi:hypothetical protein
LFTSWGKLHLRIIQDYRRWNMKFVIETPIGYVFKFSAGHQMIQMTGTMDNAKTFRSEKLAQGFIDKYSDAGYGMTKKGPSAARIIPFDELGKN